MATHSLKVDIENSELQGAIDQKIEDIARHVYVELREENRKETIREQQFREEKGKEAYPPKPKEKISKIMVDGKQVKRVIYKGEQFDLYFATPETWGALVLIRTGSAEHNIRLSTIALRKGMKLTHSGLMKNGEIIASTEKGIIEALDLSYVEPEERG